MLRPTDPKTEYRPRCPACRRLCEPVNDFMDHTLMASQSDCICGWSSYYDTGSHEESFAGRWVIHSHHADSADAARLQQATSRRRCAIWRRAWRVLKPTFIAMNWIGSARHQIRQNPAP